MMSSLADHKRSRRMIFGVIAAVVVLFGVNAVSNSLFRGAQVDLTEDGLYTLSDGTRNIMGSLEKPIKADLYFSNLLGQRSPGHKLFFSRVQELLERYASLSGGKMTLTVHSPEPFTKTEDAAVGAGLKGVAISEAGDQGFFGLVVSTDEGQKKEVIPFFNLQREQFIEYDMTKLIHGLSQTQKTVLGLMSSMPINGMRTQRGQIQPWAVMRQLGELYEVQVLNNQETVIPANIDVLLIVHPKGMPERTLYAVDQFILGGGKAMVFVDPLAESAGPMASNMGMAPQFGMMLGGRSDFDGLLKAWGVALSDTKVAGDLDAARRVSADQGGQPVVSDYVAWLELKEANFAADDVVTGDLKSINMATSGFLTRLEGAKATLTPLITTGPRSGPVNVDDVRMQPDIVSLFRDFKVEGKPYVLAARVGGAVITAYPDGQPAPEKTDAVDAKAKDGKAADPKAAAAKAAEAKAMAAKVAEADKKIAAAHLTKSKGPINVIVVADVDMLYDQFWVRIENFMGQPIMMPFANNMDFVSNALDNLTGGQAFTGLRGRGRTSRPFTLVEDVRRDAERRYRATEKELVTQLKGVQAKLAEAERKSGEPGAAQGTAIGANSAENEKVLDQFRDELVRLRQKLRDVQHALRRDIEHLESWLKFINIAAVPLVLGGGLIVLSMVRRRRKTGNAA